MSHYCIVIKTVDLVTLGFLVPPVLPSKPSSPLQWASSSNSRVQVFWSCHPYWDNHESDNYDKYEWYWPMNVMVTCGCDNYTILTCNSQWFCKGHLHAETKLCNLGIRLDTYFAAWIKKWLQVLQNCLPLLVPMFVLPWQIHQSPLAADVSFHSLSKLDRSFIVLWKWEKKSKDLPPSRLLAPLQVAKMLL